MYIHTLAVLMVRCYTQMSRWYLGSRLLLIYARRATDNVAIYRQNCFHRTEHLILCFYKQGHCYTNQHECIISRSSERTVRQK